MVEGARDDVFRRPVERLADRVVAMVRPVAGEDLVGPAPQQQVELSGDNLVNSLAPVEEAHGPASMGEPVARILLGSAGCLHDAVESDLRDCDDFPHSLFSSFPDSACRTNNWRSVWISACRIRRGAPPTRRPRCVRAGRGGAT